MAKNKVIHLTEAQIWFIEKALNLKGAVVQCDIDDETFKNDYGISRATFERQLKDLGRQLAIAENIGNRKVYYANGAELSAIANSADDMEAMIGGGEDVDSHWKKNVENIDKFFKANGLKRK